MSATPTWLPALLQSGFDEIFLIESASMLLRVASQSARDNLQYSGGELSHLPWAGLAPRLTPAALDRLLKPLRSGQLEQIALDASLVRKDGSSYPVELRMTYAPGDAGLLIAIARDVSARHDAAAALGRIESRFNAIVSNTPGLVFQFRRQADGSTSFPYLSEACHALLGISSEQLSEQPEQFLQLILPEDRNSFLESMTASAAESKGWNWDGRFWIEAWKDIKWINLRATPRALPNTVVQWEGIMTNITQSKLEEAEIKRSRAQLAELSAHVERVKEEERTRIAREIHDDLGGNLTAIKMALALLKRRLPEDAGLSEKAAYVDLLVDRTIEAIHRISIDLRPSILDFGIVAAIEWQAKEFEKQLGIPCEVNTSQAEIDLPPDQASALFRIFQESLTNISKHAQASRVAVQLSRNRRGIRLEISDNGKGIAAPDRDKPKSFGIRGMIERAHALGGTLTVADAPGGGSVVALRIPLPEQDRDDVSDE